ncbi:hypothetical protein [Bradyrhizobium sp. 930_D9_N1_4]|uniref:hypothetical protein n=1 Tax=Bradyrhizobium sp. 930_D9_N1_4 TaxID=3240374 RepID=UPI003F8A13CC
MSIADVFLKLLLAAAGVLTIVWSVGTYQRVMPFRDLEAVGYRISLGETFSPGILEGVEPDADRAIAAADCNTPAIRSAVFVKVQLYEVKGGETDRLALNKLSGDLRSAIRKSLGCSPYDPFFWFVRYWVEVSSSGISEKALRYLEMSYETGPNEGWIALRRNRFALAAFPSLGSELQKKVLSEFSELVAAGFVDLAAANLAGPGWPVREQLLAGLGDVGRYNREQFAKLLEDQGIRVDIPNFEPRQQRYWN